MLDPRERALLMESLRPPDGFSFTCAVGTTFTLDLYALLAVPLAFTLFDWTDPAGRPRAQPAAMLEALRRHAGRVHLFCQAGGIKAPRRSERLLAFLEESAIEVVAPREGGLFHPMVWALRYKSDNGAVRYRLLVMSRNLTFDRSWDTCLALEGDLTGRRNRFAANRPLEDFVAALPEMIVPGRQLRSEAAVDLALIANEIGRVRFEVPPPFTELVFHPVGIPGHQHDPIVGSDLSRVLVVSPFLDAPRLHQLTRHGDRHVLISRPEALDELDEGTRGRFTEVLVFHEDADVEAEDTDDTGDTRLTPLSGLHAKLYVAQAGHNAITWTGSANATTAGSNRNVEFMVELTGGRSTAGIDRLLDGDGKGYGLRQLLTPHVPSVDPPAESERIRRQLEEELSQVRHALGASGLSVVARETDAGLWMMTIRATAGPLPPIPAHVRAFCRPLTLADESLRRPLEATEPVATFGPHAFQTLTGFFVITLEAERKGQSLGSTFVLNLPLDGAPADRRQRLLVAILTEDREMLLRLLLLLLEDEPDLVLPADSDGLFSWDGQGNLGDGLPLFETLVRALHRAPARIAEVKRLIDEVRAAAAGDDSIFPAGLDAILAPILQAHRALELDRG